MKETKRGRGRPRKLPISKKLDLYQTMIAIFTNIPRKQRSIPLSTTTRQRKETTTFYFPKVPSKFVLATLCGIL
nr:hypothetical protein [Tanacetum cinerariifolium]